MTDSWVQPLQPWLDKLGIALPASRAAQLEALGSALLSDPFYPSVSKISDPREIVEKHFLDSLAPTHFSWPCWSQAKTILDLGTGGGFPALPLAILFPEKNVIAVDSRAKSVDFVARMASAIGLKNVRVIHARAEEIGRHKEMRGKIDLVLCRALSAVRVLVELCVPLVKPAGYALFYKGPRLEEEMKDAAAAFAELRIDPAAVELFTLKPPLLPFERGYVLFPKTRPTPETYPRRNGLPAAKPL